MVRLLLVEDDPAVASILQRGLSAAGFTVLHAGDAQSGLIIARMGDVQIIVLDLVLPTMDGMDMLTALRQEGSETPVIVLSGRDSVADRVRGLEGGADDYMTKPFHMAELVARIRLRLSSANRPSGADLEAAGLRLNTRTREVEADGVRHQLSGREFALLEAFMLSAGDVISREALLTRAWGREADIASNVVDVYVRALRKKIGRGRLQTVRGLGYRLRDEES